MKKSILFGLIVFLVPLMMQGQTIKATQDIKSPELEIGIVEHLDEYIPDDLMVIDTTGQAVSLKQLINKPTVLMWVYYRCPGICSPLMTSVQK
jgi:protein SCO1/2